MSSTVYPNVSNNDNILYRRVVPRLIEFEAQTLAFLQNPISQRGSFLPDTACENQSIDTPF